MQNVKWRTVLPALALAGVLAAIMIGIFVLIGGESPLYEKAQDQAVKHYGAKSADCQPHTKDAGGGDRDSFRCTVALADGETEVHTVDVLTFTQTVACGNDPNTRCEQKSHQFTFDDQP